MLKRTTSFWSIESRLYRDRHWLVCSGLYWWNYQKLPHHFSCSLIARDFDEPVDVTVETFCVRETVISHNRSTILTRKLSQQDPIGHTPFCDFCNKQWKNTDRRKVDCTAENNIFIVYSFIFQFQYFVRCGMTSSGYGPCLTKYWNWNIYIILHVQSTSTGSDTFVLSVGPCRKTFSCNKARTSWTNSSKL